MTLIVDADEIPWTKELAAGAPSSGLDAVLLGVRIRGEIDRGR